MADDSATIERSAVLQTPAGSSGITFTHLAGRDEISRCFSYTIGFATRNRELNPLDFLGGAMSLRIESAPSRWVSGIVSEFRVTGVEERVTSYETTVRPWLWLLGNTTDCRIFQNMSVVEIVEKIFSKYDVAKFEKRLQGSYQPREYCVQFDESDLDFVQRLLEHEGIFYFFEHAEGKHTLILADATGNLKPAPHYETVSFQPRGYPVRSDKEYITEWLPGTSVRPGAYAHTDYDFEKPGADLMAKSSHPRSHKEASGENYRQPGAHLDVGRGDRIASIRREELQAPHQRARAVGNVRGLYPGCTFKLEDFPREDQNQEYLVVRAEMELTDPEFRGGAGDGGGDFSIVMEVAPTRLPYRPPRLTPRPVMRGPQTATVVGPSGEEIFTDKYARVKVQFHWDRLGKKDQNSSCFVRVSQGWAGSNWGFIQIPRIGQEVIVEFIEGDPDRPIITGRVYNAAQMPPYGLPGNATQSGFKSNSSKGGGGWNELRFEDKAGSEEVYFQAQKDHTLLVKNDRSKHVQHDQSDRIDHDARHSVGVDLDEDVGNNKTTSVGVNRSVRIGSNDTETVGANRSLTVGANETIGIGANSSETIGANHSQTVGLVQTVTVGAARIDTVGADETRSVGAARTLAVGGEQSHTVGVSDSWQIGTDQSVAIGGSQSTEIGSSRSASVGGDATTSIGGARGVSVGKSSALDAGEDVSIHAGKNVVIDAGDSITLKCGSATITMKKDGTIVIDGKDITTKGSGKITIKADSDVIVKGSTINNN